MTINDKYKNNRVWLLIHQTIFLSGVDKKAIRTLMRFTSLWNGCLITFKGCIHETEEFSLYIKKKKGFLKKNISSKWNRYLFVSFLWLSLYLYTELRWCSIDVVRNKIKSSRKEYFMWTCFTLWPMKNIFRKL